MPQSFSVKKVLVHGAVVFVFLLGVFVFSFLHGEPVHDINLWMLENSFYAKDIPHPEDSIVAENKKYLGGPSLHGGNRCVYAVGEVRTAPLSKEEIKRAYQNATIHYWNTTLPLRMLFIDEHGPYTLPYVTWQDDLVDISKRSAAGEDTVYVVYASVEHPILLFDYRCDD
jgi:hypothetical protein